MADPLDPQILQAIAIANRLRTSDPTTRVSNQGLGYASLTDDDLLNNSDQARATLGDAELAKLHAHPKALKAILGGN